MQNLSEYNAEIKNNSNPTFDRLLPATKNYKRIKPVDISKTIYLVSKAKGNRTLREFASEVGQISFVAIFRILNGHTVKIGKKGIAGIVSAAEPGSQVTLDSLMAAQGCFNDNTLAKYYDEIRQIVINDLLTKGLDLRLPQESSKDDIKNSKQSKFTILINRLSPHNPSHNTIANTPDNLLTWNFEIITAPLLRMDESLSEYSNQIISRLLTKNFGTRKSNKFSLLIDNEQFYNEIKDQAELIQIPYEVSIILISLAHKKVLDEFVVPLSNKQPNIIKFQRIKLLHESKYSFSFDESYLNDCRSIIADDLLQKGYAISNKDSCVHLPDPGIIELQPDFTYSVTGEDNVNNIRTFNVMRAINFSNYDEFRQAVLNWTLRAMACFYTGNYEGMLSLVIDDPIYYQSIIEELSVYNIPDSISLLLVSEEDRKICEEKLIPLNI